MVEIECSAKGVGHMEKTEGGATMRVLFIREHKSPDMVGEISIRILDENEYLLFNGTVLSGGIVELLMAIRGNGVYPDRVYMDLWSEYRDSINSVWPEAEVLIDYNG
ncbi:MAG: hypothetical protein L7F77_10750 [Candidatus Magnetominusculus sp. LBB02]|nr:hypothetical protein [Candidatus Magnetominusculus sp. LBB02]